MEDENELFFIKEELEEKRNLLDNVMNLITSLTKALDNASEIEEKLIPGVYGDLDKHLSIVEELKTDIKIEIENLEEKEEYYELNPMWKKERIQQEKEYWNTQF